MLTIHPGRTLAAGALLGMTLSGLVYSQEGLQLPTINPPTKLGAPQSVAENHGKTKSPYQPMLSEGGGSNTAVGVTEDLEAPRRIVAPSNPTCISPTGASPGPLERPSLWQRFKSGMHRYFVGYPEEFTPPPLGDALYLHGRIQVANGEAARMVLYDYDFLPGGDRLNRRGEHQLEKMTTLLPCNFFPIIVEETPDIPLLSRARRLAVLNELTRYPFPVPPERVVVGRPLAGGLRGVEADVIYRNLIDNTKMKGAGGGGQTGGGTSAVNINIGASATAGAQAGAGGGGPDQSSPP